MDGTDEAGKAKLMNDLAADLQESDGEEKDIKPIPLASLMTKALGQLTKAVRFLFLLSMAKV